MKTPKNPGYSPAVKMSMPMPGPKPRAEKAMSLPAAPMGMTKGQLNMMPGTQRTHSMMPGKPGVM